jgi:GDPmannose 4,6-dehydratase
MMKALITGINGQDGSYLAHMLLLKGYQVHGLIRRSSIDSEHQLVKLRNQKDKYILHYGDLTDHGFMSVLLMTYEFDEIYNLGAMSDVAISFRNPVYTMSVNCMAVCNILEVLRHMNEMGKECKFYQASTSEMFGGSEYPLNENSPMIPKSPYALSKYSAHELVRIYRESYGLFAVSGILFNHESRCRGSNFVTQKIVNGALDFETTCGEQVLTLGNLDAKRDWGASHEFCRAMWLMLQNDEPTDYVVGTGKSYSVREFCELAFKKLGYKIKWEGTGINEKGYTKIDGKKKLAIQISPRFYRPNEVHNLIADAKKINEECGWIAKKDLSDIIDDMFQPI